VVVKEGVPEGGREGGKISVLDWKRLEKGLGDYKRCKGGREGGREGGDVPNQGEEDAMVCHHLFLQHSL